MGYQDRKATKKLWRDEMIEAYNVAIEGLHMHESDSDTELSKAARMHLAKRLDKQCDRWLKSLKD